MDTLRRLALLVLFCVSAAGCFRNLNEADLSDSGIKARIEQSLASQQDPRVYTAKARARFLSKFEAQVDPAGVLEPEERQRRAQAARKAHFARMALKSAKARARKTVAKI